MRGIGYLVSIVSVLLVGAVAWPRPDEPDWKILALLVGMAASIVGMILRWIASHKQATELHAVERQQGFPQR
jgi:hypothetical protein